MATVETPMDIPTGHIMTRLSTVTMRPIYPEAKTRVPKPPSPGDKPVEFSLG